MLILLGVFWILRDWVWHPCFRTFTFLEAKAQMRTAQTHQPMKSINSALVSEERLILKGATADSKGSVGFCIQQRWSGRSRCTLGFLQPVDTDTPPSSSTAMSEDGSRFHSQLSLIPVSGDVTVSVFGSQLYVFGGKNEEQDFNDLKVMKLISPSERQPGTFRYGTVEMV